jgi:hypothetical protein
MSRRVALAAAGLSVLTFVLAAAGLASGGVAPALAILSVTVEAPFQAPPTALAGEWVPFVLGLVAVVALGFGVVALRRPPPASRP